MKRALLLVLSLSLWDFSAYAQTPFYQGKTIRVIVGTPPGNLYDFWARLIVEHMGKHIPGNPQFPRSEYAWRGPRGRGQSFIYGCQTGRAYANWFRHSIALSQSTDRPAGDSI